MDVEDVAVASVTGGDDEGMAIDDEADVANETFVKNLVNGRPIIDSPLRLANHTRTRGWRCGIRHAEEAPGNREELRVRLTINVNRRNQNGVTSADAPAAELWRHRSGGWRSWFHLRAPASPRRRSCRRLAQGVCLLGSHR